MCNIRFLAAPRRPLRTLLFLCVAAVTLRSRYIRYFSRALQPLHPLAITFSRGWVGGFAPRPHQHVAAEIVSVKRHPRRETRARANSSARSGLGRAAVKPHPSVGLSVGSFGAYGGWRRSGGGWRPRGQLDTTADRQWELRRPPTPAAAQRPSPRDALPSSRAGRARLRRHTCCGRGSGWRSAGGSAAACRSASAATSRRSRCRCAHRPTATAAPRLACRGGA